MIFELKFPYFYGVNLCRGKTGIFKKLFTKYSLK